MKTKQLHIKGFHLIEMLITLAIIAIVAAVSLPTYSQYLVYAKRLEAESALAKLAIAMEHYYIEHNTYRDAKLDILFIPSQSVKNNYQLLIQSVTDNTYSLTATPLGNQAKQDSACGVLALNSLGEKSINGLGNVEECW